MKKIFIRILKNFLKMKKLIIVWQKLVILMEMEWLVKE